MTDIPHKSESPLAESARGDVPQKTCAYGAEEAKLAGQKRSDLTGASRSTATKREARSALTSELGQKAMQPAGLPAPAGYSHPAEVAIIQAEREFLLSRGVIEGPQPVVAMLDYPADEDATWEELTAKAERLSPPTDQKTLTERVLARMGE